MSAECQERTLLTQTQPANGLPGSRGGHFRETINWKHFDVRVYAGHSVCITTCHWKNDACYL